MIARLMGRNKRVVIPSIMTSNLPLSNLPEHIQDIATFVQLSKEDIEHLQLIDDIMEEHAAEIAERHYEMLMSNDELKKIFNTFTTYDRYVPAITNYYKQLTKPALTKEYIEFRKNIGTIHSRNQHIVVGPICR